MSEVAMSESVLWNEMGNLHMRLGAFEDAISSYGKAIELSPKFSLAYSNLGLAYYSKGKYKDAISLHQKSLEYSKTNPEKSIVWKRLGDAYQKQGKYEKALAAYKMGDELEVNPETGSGITDTNTTEQIGSGLTISISNQETEQVNLSEEIPTTLSSESVADGNLEQTPGTDLEFSGEDLTDTNRFEPQPAATPPFLPTEDTPVDENYPKEEWHVDLQDQGSEPESISQNSKAANEEFGELNNWLQSLDTNPSCAISNHQSRNFDEVSSKTSLDRETKTDPEPNPSRENHFIMVDANTEISKSPLLGIQESWVPSEPLDQACQAQNAFLVKRLSTQAVQLLEQTSRSELFKSWKLTEQPEHDTNVWKSMMEVLEKSQSEQNAVLEPSDQSNRVQIEKPTPKVLPLEKSKLNRELADSIENYKKITNVAPANDKAWDTLGKLLKDAGEYGDAVAAFERAISLCPNKDLYYYHLGLVFAAQKRHDDAIHAFQKVVDINPGYILAHCALAGSYRRLGMDMEAETHIKVALPRLDAETEYNRACFEAICGNNDQAIELLKLALEKKQTSPEWVRGDPDLDFIRDDPRFKTLVGP
jgi:tetratricopeptide (TPR) repeat protein